MRVIHVLDKYIAGDITGGNKLLLGGCVKELHDDPEMNVHGLLLAFCEKGLEFTPVLPPSSTEEVENLLASEQEPSQKYVYALYLMKYHNPITTVFVDLVLDRLETL